MVNHRLPGGDFYFGKCMKVLLKYTARIVYNDLLSLSSKKRCFFRVNFLINTAFENFKMRCLLGGGVY